MTDDIDHVIDALKGAYSHSSGHIINEDDIEAAKRVKAEIERLRAEFASCDVAEQQANQQCMLLNRTIQEQDNEIERLRDENEELVTAIANYTREIIPTKEDQEEVGGDD